MRIILIIFLTFIIPSKQSTLGDIVRKVENLKIKDEMF